MIGALLGCVLFGFVVGAVLGLRLGFREGVSDERAWARTIYRIRKRGGKCGKCGNFRAPEPIPAGIRPSELDAKGGPS